MGAGFLGAALVRQLAAPAVATTRTGAWTRDGAPPTGVTLRALDVIRGDDEQLDRALSGSAAVVVCFAPGRDQPREDLYVGGARRLVAASARAGTVQRLVYTSSTSALPDRDGWVDDDCDERPTSERGLVQRRAEDEIRSGCEHAGIPWVVLRLGGLYGPGRGLGRIYDPARPTPRRDGQSADAPLRGHGMQATNLIHRDDAVRAVLAALRLPHDRSGVVNVCADDHRPRRELYALVAERRGLPPPRWAEPPPERDRVVGKRVRNDRMKAWLGLTLEHNEHTLETP